MALSVLLEIAVDTASSVVTGPKDGEIVAETTSLVVVTGPNEAETVVEGVPTSVCPEVTVLSTGSMVVGSPVPVVVTIVTGVSTA
jgi:hypothetical protein